MENVKINYSSMKQDGFDRKGVPVHSQVRRIKQESEKIPDLSPGQPETRPALREIIRQIPRSPLGISGGALS
ncbi:hypothetical protein L6164_006378 [Bauhinia variegata]|uniref:Uncharacterized protein n=1 Tax=Bauhinia variegata TaxID=167791 RepID=A0ACB9PTN5_BAUVA|nr:hypothetical protein L6164_006378 [Bauhinia variegata]